MNTDANLMYEWKDQTHWVYFQAPKANLPSLSLLERCSLPTSQSKEEPDDVKVSSPVLEDQPKG